MSIDKIAQIFEKPGSTSTEYHLILAETESFLEGKMQARERERERRKEVDKRMTPQQTIRHAYISTLKKLGFEEEKGQLREWMTVARDRAEWALS
jgi:hypothetical protein